MAVHEDKIHNFISIMKMTDVDSLTSISKYLVSALEIQFMIHRKKNE